MSARFDVPRPARAAQTRLAALAIAGAAALALTPRHAESQLLKRVRQAAAERLASAGGAAGAKKVGGEPAAAAPAARSSSQLEITPERVAALIAAMTPAAAAAERKRAAGVRQAAYEKRRKEWETCVNMKQATLQGQQPSEAAIEENGRLLERANAMQARLMAAYQANQVERSAALQDSMTALTVNATMALYPSLKSCGEYVYAPTAPAGSVAADSASAPIPPAGMTKVQFGILRERVAAFVITNGAEGQFSPAERAALGSRQQQLAPFAALFKDGTLQWQSWGDLTGEW
jgi:hypothetical protein